MGMANDDPRRLLDELSSQILLCEIQNPQDLASLSTTLSQLESTCSADQWKIFAEAADAYRAMDAQAASDQVVAVIDALARCCIALEPLLFLGDTAADAPVERREESKSTAGLEDNSWGFDDPPRQSEELTAKAAPIDSFVMGGTITETVAQDVVGQVRPIARDPEEVENMVDFYSEAQEAVDHNERLLLESQDQLADSSIGALFRAFHTIKGIAGFVGLTQPSKLAHSTESLLGGVRRGDVVADGLILDLLLESNHCMEGMVESVRSALEAQTTVPLDEHVDELCERIDAAIEESEQAKRTGAQPPQAAASETKRQISETTAETSSPAPVAQLVPSSAPADASPVSASTGEQTNKPPATAPPPEAPTSRAPSRSQGSSQIRDTLKVDVGRVDSLVEMVGEMVIVESMITGDEELRRVRSPKLANNLRQMAKITRDLQKIALQLRMVPVRGLFTRTARMVRELSRQCNKPIRFTAEGEGTEMDRNMVELLADPLVHIIRNAVDHGIESEEERKQADKPAEGAIQISAYHESSNLVIEVSDDGKGLNVEKLVARGRERGLITAGQTLSESEVYELIFAPGFSTADKVTGLSGRGVGMDVVRKNIKSMRGRIGIQSKPGLGTTFRLVLPLTLAIIDGTLIACGEETYILPTLSILESIRPKQDMVRAPGGRGQILQVRGKTYPLYQLADLLDIEGARSSAHESHAIIVESASHSYALQVDDVISQQQVVIKGLEKQLKSKIFSGAAILSDGQIGLILNVDEIVALSSNRLGDNFVGVA